MSITDDDIRKNSTMYQVPSDKKEYQKMEKKLEKIEDILSTMAIELKMTSHITKENSQNMEKFLSSMDDSKKRLFDKLEKSNLAIHENEIEITHLKTDLSTVRALLWKVTGAVVSGLISIVVYLTIKQ